MFGEVNENCTTMSVWGLDVLNFQLNPYQVVSQSAQQTYVKEVGQFTLFLEAKNNQLTNHDSRMIVVSPSRHFVSSIRLGSPIEQDTSHNKT